MNVKDIKNKFDQIQNNMRAVAENFPWENKEAYVSWLAQTYDYALCTTRILAMTGANFPLHQTPLASRFIQHATEEKGHDKLLVNDAKALGCDLHSLKLLPEAEAFHKSVYYWIHQHRLGVVMGWALFLEGFAVKYGPMIHERAEKCYGKKPTSFLRVHTQEDPDHVDKAFEVLNGFSEKELEDVAHGFELYSKLYANIYTAVAEQAGERKQGKKAA